MFACLADLNHIAYDVVAMCAGTAKATVGTVVCAVAVAKFVRMTPIGNHTPTGRVKRINSGSCRQGHIPPGHGTEIPCGSRV